MAEPERCRERVMLEVGGATDCNLPLPCPVHGPEQVPCGRVNRQERHEPHTFRLQASDDSPKEVTGACPGWSPVMAEPERCGQVYEPRPGALYRRCKRPAGHNGEHGPENAGGGAAAGRAGDGAPSGPSAPERPPGVVPSAEARPPADDDLSDEHSDLTAELALHGLGGEPGQDLASDLIRWFVARGWRPPGATTDRDALAEVITTELTGNLPARVLVEMPGMSQRLASAVLALLAGEETTDEPEQCGQPYWRYFGHGLCSRPIGHDGWCGPQPSDVDAPRRKETTDGV